MRKKRREEISFRALWLAAALAALAWPHSAPAAETPAAAREVTAAEQIEFEQKKAQAHMQELQERMFRLAELTRELEPDDSARLLLAVQKAREELIVEQMKDILALFDKKDLGLAVSQQKEVIHKLEELRELLLSTDVDFRIKLDRLRKLEAILKKLDPAIQEENRQAERAGEMARKPPADAKPFEDLRKDQEHNRRATGSIQEMVKELGPALTGAAGELAGAGAAMAGAEGDLGQKSADKAAGQQGEAAKAMGRARQQLQAERVKLVNELARQARDQVLANLTEMLERQKKVRESTQALAPKALAGQREAALAVQRLAPPQERLVEMVDQTVTLVEQTRFSLALPPALRSVQRRMVYVGGDLKAGRAGPEVVQAQQQIEKDLQELISALKDAAPSAPRDNPDGQPGQGKEERRNKLLAELRIIRLLQARVNEETLDADGRRAKAQAELSPEMKEKIGLLHEHQEQVHDTMVKLHQAVAGDGAD